MQREVHQFENGIKIFDDHLTRFQRDRYKLHNVHEAVEEDVFVKIVAELPANGCFVNIGAAVGYYVMLAKKLAPGLAIHAVEPLAQHRKFLSENIRLNGFRQNDFTIHNEAVGRLNGSEYFLEQDYGSMLLPGATPVKPFQALLEAIFKRKAHPIVRTITLDTLIKRIGRTIDLLLMDIQGLEADVLRGGAHTLQSGSIKTLLIGTHGQEIHLACLGILRESGFAIEYEEPNPANQPDGIIHASWR